ncbi:MAG: 3-hydroxybutyryl-CoA dehydrogenase [Chitinophagaceae bacterium]|nr:3-hydroxybutyryl-CoA dehydrogenase [Chitinophagaceae bacterium]
MIKTICICGSGTMGSGIAQVCAQSGFNTILFDVNEIILERSKETIKKNLQYLTDKQKISSEEKERIFFRIQFTKDIKNCVGDVIIEAIVEILEAKVNLFNQLAAVNDAHTIFATNTSSLSVTAIQKNIVSPERVVGMHFFNPAPVMKLIEVVKGEMTNNGIVETIYALCKQISKHPVMCKDAPGFIVNRVARHYYLEAMKLVEEEIATFENIDIIMESVGFKMGPFKLMDLIGMDINLSVSQSMYEAFNRTERFKPSQIQIEKVKKGELGKKTGKGFYDYDPIP